jgi:hypothetical protein
MTNTLDPEEMRINRNYGLCALGSAAGALALLVVLIWFALTGLAFWAVFITIALDLYFGSICAVNWYKGRNGGVA